MRDQRVFHVIGRPDYHKGDETMIQGFGHIGIAVRDIRESLDALSKALDISVPEITDHPDKMMRVAVVDLYGVALEFIEDYNPNGVFADFVKERGNGIHHICLLSNDIESDSALLQSRGIEMWIPEARIGLRGKRIVFTQPSALNGIPLELSEP